MERRASRPSDGTFRTGGDARLSIDIS